MRILITGANGFIAREIIAHLTMQGHEIIACVHQDIFSNIPVTRYFKVDFSKASTLEFWLPHLKDIEVVINCVGVFQINTDKMWKIHYETPKALMTACTQSQIKKIIHISALGIDKVKVPYAESKLALEEYLTSLAIDSTIIRPGLVYGKGSYGGSSLFRGLAGLPFILPLPTHAEQLQQPIHIDDLVQIVHRALTLPGKQVICAVGAEKLSVKNILIKLRHWLGFKKAYPLRMPDFFLKIGAKLGNFIKNSPLSDTAIQMMTVDNTATIAEEKFLETFTHFKPRGFSDGLKGMVSSVQDRWHARLYFLRPLLRLSIAFVWLWSGIISLLSPTSTQLMSAANIPLPLQPWLLYLSSTIDILLGMATLVNIKLRITGTLQCLFILGYTLVFSLLLPSLWIEPLGPLTKNIPLFIATLIMLAIESER